MSDAHGDAQSWERELLAAADHRPHDVIDDGAELALHLALHRPDTFRALKGVSGKTTTGTARLFAMQAASKLNFPALTADNTLCKHLFDNRYGARRATIQAVLRLTNRQIAGVAFCILGCGYAGRGIAEFARRMGAHTRMVEVDPVRALEAHMDGRVVGNARDVLPGALVICWRRSSA